MNGFVRTFLLWVMVFAMPVQGWAASFMLSCGPGHERMQRNLLATPDLAVPAAGHGHGHEHAADASFEAPHGHGQGHDHAHAPAHPPTADAAQNADDGADGGAGGGTVPHGKFSCSACAACCLMTMVSTRPMAPARTELLQRVVPTTVAVRPSHLPAGLDRPPRPRLA